MKRTLLIYHVEKDPQKVFKRIEKYLKSIQKVIKSIAKGSQKVSKVQKVQKEPRHRIKL